MLNKRLVVKRVICFLSTVTMFGYLSWCIFGFNNQAAITSSSSSSSPASKSNEELRREKEEASRIQRLKQLEEEQKIIEQRKKESFKTTITRLHNMTHPNEHGHITTLTTMTNCSKPYFLLILVSSAPSNIERRKGIRQTWGVDNAIKPRWKTVFLVAQSPVQSESDLLQRESKIFGDLVRADYHDDYWNQTLKIQMGFEWAAKHCNFSFLLKIDDDVFVNLRTLLSNLSKPSMPREKLYMGLLWVKLPVRRYKGDKWEVTKKEYEPDFYPDYCPGFGFVLSADVVHLFVDLFDVVEPFRIDDVYVGMLAKWAGVNGTNNGAFIEKPSPPQVPCTLDNRTMVWHGITGDCLFKLFHDSFYLM